jgi:hypothetical protein
MSWLSRGFDQTYGAAWNNLTNRGDPNRGNQRTSDYQGPGAGYGEPRENGFTWLPDAGERILRDHPLDEQGLPTGYDGPLPSNIAMQVQAVHEKRIWQQRQAMMQDAVRGARGAASLLSSFRPGGGAAIESGIYSQVAGLQMQRAMATQPLDLLGDYRRDQDSRARMQSNRAAERTLAIQAVGTIAAIATAGAGAGLAGAAIAGASSAYSANQNRKAAEATAGGNKPSAMGAPGQGFQDMGTPQYGPEQAPQQQGGGSAMGAPMGGLDQGGGGGRALAAPVDSREARSRGAARWALLEAVGRFLAAMASSTRPPMPRTRCGSRSWHTRSCG